MPAEERRELILAAARREFALHGLDGASTNTIAEGAGISQPYVFQLFTTKKELFLAVLERSFDETLEQLQAAAQQSRSGEVFAALGSAYVQQLSRDEEGLMVFVQLLAACTDDDVRRRMRQRFGELYQYIERTSGANDEAVRTLLAYAMLAAAAAAMRLPEIAGDQSWAQRLLGFLDALEDG